MILSCYIAAAVGASKPRASGDDPCGLLVIGETDE